VIKGEWKLKNKIVLLCSILLSSILFACNATEVKNNEVQATFVGIIEEVHGESATVFVTETEDKISGLVTINLTVNDDDTFQVGDKVKVGYDGTTMEISPITIKTLTLEKVE